MNEEFKTLAPWSKAAVIGSWVAEAGAVILLGSSALTIGAWTLGVEPDALVKKSLALGLGMVTSGVLFATGAAQEADNRFFDDVTLGAQAMMRQSKQKAASKCPGCKYFNDDCQMYCAINPTTACTPAADSCSDFEPKEI